MFKPKFGALGILLLVTMFLIAGTALADEPPPGTDPEEPREGWGSYDAIKM